MSVSINLPEKLSRNWGTESIVVQTPVHVGKILDRKKGTKGGFQCHVKEESHYLVSGRLKLELVERGEIVVVELHGGEAWTVPPMTFHREEALTDCVLFEVSDPTTEDRYPIIPDPGGLPPMTDEQAILKVSDYAAALRLRAAECDHLARQIRAYGLNHFAPPIKVLA